MAKLCKASILLLEEVERQETGGWGRAFLLMRFILLKSTTTMQGLLVGQLWQHPIHPQCLSDCFLLNSQTSVARVQENSIFPRWWREILPELTWRARTLGNRDSSYIPKGCQNLCQTPWQLKAAVFFYPGYHQEEISFPLYPFWSSCIELIIKLTQEINRRRDELIHVHGGFSWNGT